MNREIDFIHSRTLEEGLDQRMQDHEDTLTPAEYRTQKALFKYTTYKDDDRCTTILQLVIVRALQSEDPVFILGWDCNPSNKTE